MSDNGSMSDNYTITVTGAQLEDVLCILGATKQELKARKVPAKRVATGSGSATATGTPTQAKTAQLPPHDAMAQAFGIVSDELDRWMTERATAGFVTHYKPVPAFSNKPKTSPLPKNFFSEEKSWNSYCERMWKNKAQENGGIADYSAMHTAGVSAR